MSVIAEHKVSYLFGSPSDSPVFFKGFNYLLNKGFQAYFQKEDKTIAPISELTVSLEDYVQENSIQLRKDNITIDFRCLSAHRTREEIINYFEGGIDSRGKSYEGFNPDAIIAGAGLTNALVNACTDYGKLIVGVPIKSSKGGLDSFLSTVQTPPDYPIAAVPIDRADIALEFVLKALESPTVYVVEGITPEKTIKKLNAFTDVYTKVDSIEKAVNGFVIADYTHEGMSLIKETAKVVKKAGSFMIGVNEVEVQKDEPEVFGWYEDHAKSDNVVIVGNTRMGNAGLLVAQIQSLHDQSLDQKIANYRKKKADDKYEGFYWRGPWPKI